MPFDYPNFREYEFDYDELHSYISSNQRFDFLFFNEWLDSWIKILKNTEIDTQKQIKNLYKNGIYNFEVFQQSIHFGDLTFKLNFIINGADDFVKREKPKVQRIKSTNFYRKIKWTEEYKLSTKSLSKPIYIVLFPMGYDGLVIDGNHRLTQLLKKKQNTIDSIILYPEEIVGQNILLFTVEKAMYAFILEFHRFNHSLQMQFDHEQLFKTSFIHNSFKKFVY